MPVAPGGSPPARTVLVVGDGPLAPPVAAALAARGWGPHGSAAEADGRRARVVLLEDAAGRLRLDEVARVVRAGGEVVAVGAPASRAVLASALDLGAGWAVESSLSFTDMLDLVEHALRADGRPPAHARAARARALRRRADEAARFARLTDRECEVLAELAAGRSVTQVARGRPVAVSTVRAQVASLLLKLETSSQTAAVAMAFRSCHDRRVLEVLRHRQDDG